MALLAGINIIDRKGIGPYAGQVPADLSTNIQGVLTAWGFNYSEIKELDQAGILT